MAPRRQTKPDSHQPLPHLGSPESNRAVIVLPYSNTARLDMGVGADINAGRPERYGNLITGYKYAPSIGGTTIGHFAPTSSQRLTWSQWEDITAAATQSITALEAEIASSPWATVYSDAKTAAAALNLVSDLQNRVMEQFAAWDGLGNGSDWLLRK